MDRRSRSATLAALAAVCCALTVQAAPLAPFQTAGDAIEAPLDDLQGDPARGRAIIVNRQKGLCLLCHTGPFTEQRFQGDLAPDLSGVGTRLTEGQLRLRLVDSTALNAASIMPSYHRIAGLTRVAEAHKERPILSAQDIEDVVAFLVTLRDPPPSKDRR
jgi:sulfur-oxidizing protein SoxX